MGRISKLLQRMRQALRLDSNRSLPSTSSIDLIPTVKRNKNPLPATVSAVPEGIDPDAPLMPEIAEVEGLFAAYNQFYYLQNRVIRAQEALEKQLRTVGDLTFQSNEAWQDLKDFQYRSKNQGLIDKIRISPAIIAMQEVLLERAKAAVSKAEKVLDDLFSTRENAYEALLKQQDVITSLEKKHSLENLPLKRLKAYFVSQKELAETRNEILLSKLDVLARECGRAHEKWKSAVADADQQGSDLRKEIAKYNHENAFIRRQNAKGKPVPQRASVRSEIKNLTDNYMGARKIARGLERKFQVLDDEYNRVDAAVTAGAATYAKFSVRITDIQNTMDLVEMRAQLASKKEIRKAAQHKLNEKKAKYESVIRVHEAVIKDDTQFTKGDLATIYVNYAAENKAYLPLLKADRKINEEIRALEEQIRTKTRVAPIGQSEHSEYSNALAGKAAGEGLLKGSESQASEDNPDTDAIILQALRTQKEFVRTSERLKSAALSRELKVRKIEVEAIEARHRRQMAGLKASPKKSVTTIPLPSDLPVGAQEQTENDLLSDRLGMVNAKLETYEPPLKTLEGMFERLSANPFDKDYDADFAFVTGEWTRLHALRVDGLEEVRKITQQLTSQTSAANDTNRKNAFSAEVSRNKKTSPVALAGSYTESAGTVAPKSRVDVPTPTIDIDLGQQPPLGNDVYKHKVA